MFNALKKPILIFGSFGIGKSERRSFSACSDRSSASRVPTSLVSLRSIRLNAPRSVPPMGSLSAYVVARRFGSVNVIHCNPDETFAPASILGSLNAGRAL